MSPSMKRLWRAFSGQGKREVVENRSETRLPAHGPVLVRRDFQGTETEAVSFVGVSEHGLSFRSELPIAPEQKILVEADGQELHAVVRHSSQDGREFVVGAEILAVSGRPESSTDAV